MNSGHVAPHCFGFQIISVKEGYEIYIYSRGWMDFNWLRNTSLDREVRGRVVKGEVENIL